MKVHVSLNDGFFFVGSVVDASDDSITLNDIKGKLVSVSRDNIISIREVSR